MTQEKIYDKLEGLMVIKSLRAIEDADIVIVITADEGMSTKTRD